MSEDWTEVRARVSDLGRLVDAGDRPALRVAVGRLVDAVRHWHAAQDAAIAASLSSGPDERRAAVCAEERLQRVDELIERIWAAAESAPEDIGAILDELAVV